MGSVSDDKHNAAAKAAVSNVLRSSGRRRDDAVRKLIDLCENEIEEGLKDGIGPLAVAPQHEEMYRQLVRASAERVIGTAKEKKPPDLPHYVRECSAEVAREAKAKQEAWLRNLAQEPKPAADPRYGPALVAPGCCFGARSAIDDQRSALVEFVHLRKGGQRSEVQLDDEHEPEDAQWWIIWYVGRLYTLKPQAKMAFLREGKPSQTCLLIDSSGTLGS